MKKIIFLSLLNIFSLNCLYNNDINSNNFINRWQFQKIADFIYDPSTKLTQIPSKDGGISFNPKDVKDGDIIFVRHVHKFFKFIHPKIFCKYIIITHGNYQDSFLEEYTKYLADDKIIAWFAVHANIGPEKFNKFYPIPIGVWQNQDIHKNKQEINSLFQELRAKNKTKLIYNNFTEGMHLERSEVVDIFKKRKFDIITEKRDFITYINEMSEYKFTASPRGMGIDCYRTWEALLVGSIPIVKSSDIDILYKDLPVLIIDDWEKIDTKYLEKKYKEITSKKYSINKLYIDYWINIIKSKQEKYLNLAK